MKLIAGEKVDENTLQMLLDSIVRKYDGQLSYFHIRPSLQQAEVELLDNWRYDGSLTIEQVVDYIKKSRSGEIKLFSVCYMEEEWEQKLPINAKPICKLQEGYIYYVEVT